MVDLTRNILAVRVKNAEKQLLRAQGAEDHYGVAAAKVALKRALEELEAYRWEGSHDGD